MYKAFKDNNESLPGEESVLQIAEPSIKINLLPIKVDTSDIVLPKLSVTHVVLQPNMTIEAIKKYVAAKLNMDYTPKDIDIMFKNQILKDYLTLKDVNEIYHFSTEKNILHYAKK